MTYRSGLVGNGAYLKTIGLGSEIFNKEPLRIYYFN